MFVAVRRPDPSYGWNEELPINEAIGVVSLDPPISCRSSEYAEQNVKSQAKIQSNERLTVTILEASRWNKNT